MFRPITKLLILLVTLGLFNSCLAGDPLWIDVRTAEEFGQGHVPGAVNIPYEQIAGRIGEVTDDKEALVYLYCRSGRRSGIAKDALDRAGFSQVVNIGGFEDAMRKAVEQQDP
jgi:phage shock protein E